MVDKQTAKTGKVGVSNFLSILSEVSMSIHCSRCRRTSHRTIVRKLSQIQSQIAVCRLNDPKKEKEVAWCILKPAEESTLYLGGLDSNLDWVDDVRHGKYEVEL